MESEESLESEAYDPYNQLQSSLRTSIKNLEGLKQGKSNRKSRKKWNQPKKKKNYASDSDNKENESGN
jgi:hypothetical protein